MRAIFLHHWVYISPIFHIQAVGWFFSRMTAESTGPVSGQHHLADTINNLVALLVTVAI
jgi:hypothetical protein